MVAQLEHQVAQLIVSIKGHRSPLVAEAKRLRTPKILEAFDRWNHDSWCLSVAGDCLIRLRLFTEQNFNFVETIGTVSVARYIFELSVWLHLFHLDSRYGLVYYAELLGTQRRYWDDYRKQLRREIDLLRQFEREEKSARDAEIRRIKHLTDQETQKNALLVNLKAISEHIDEKAARRFSVYAEQAKVNGYGFQAHLVEKKSIPHIDSELTAVNSHVSQEVKGLMPKRWNWQQMAQKVGLQDEYDFIYTFSSKLLHATPASITTDQKNLEVPELVVFLKYINVQILDVIELTRQYAVEAA